MGKKKTNMQYDDIDFNKLYIDQKNNSSFKSKPQEAWDKKASSMNKKVHSSIYNDEFLNILNSQNCKTLLDVGCGVGNLSIKLSSKLERIYALDYSDGMLEVLKENIKQKNITNIECIKKSWYDDWNDVPKSDIVIASRSMEVSDMRMALEKLNEKANKRVYISYKVGGSFISDEILAVIQRKIIKKPDYIYLLNILYQMGINASVNFIKSESRNSMYTTFDEFIKSIVWSIGDLTLEEIDKLKIYYQIIENKKNRKKMTMLNGL